MDIWAVGVILLSFLTNVYPFFDPEDSAAGIVELISVFGTKKVHEFAKFYGEFLMM
jgi:cell division control protein 7